MSRNEPACREPVCIAVSGSAGLIGRPLVRLLVERGHDVRRLVRDRSWAAPGDVYWNPATSELDVAALEGADAVVHLAGENIAGGRWTAARKAAIRDSRVRGTTLLCEGLAQLARPPRVLIAASAVGYYGDGGDAVLKEQSAAGTGFLADVTREWEAATQPASQAGVRVVNLRTGMVLARAGGALPRMLTPFKLGLGGRVGSGRQYMSWIALRDLLGAIEYLLFADDISGPVNAVAPTPVTNKEFTRTLGRVLRRPTILPLPAFAVRVLFGQMGRELLLASTRAVPQRLLTGGFSFGHPRLEEALRAELAADD